MQTLEQIVSDVAAPALPRRPYPGLRPFTLDEDLVFFGREPMIDEIIGLLAKRCLILVHGSSGSGKSSLILAGVLPRLARQHRRHGWRWRTASMRPGGGPLWNLARALAELEGGTPSAARVNELRLSFDRTGADLTQIVTHLAGMEQERLCLLVDQFEELFRYARETSREESRLFVDLITTVLKQDSASPVRVILTMRSEFLGECARLPGLAAVVNTAQYLLPRMDTASMRRAIRRPAELYGGSVTIELADRLIADVQGSQDELPLIQHGLMRMWDLAGEAAPGKQAPRRLDLPLYEAHGPLARLLDQHAEAVALAAAPDESSRRVVENLFRALSDINADGHAIRRPQTVQSLIAVTGAERGRLISILDAFRSDGVSFLTPYAPAGLDNETMIDVSHEALIRCWNSLAAAPDGWLHREFRDGLIWQSLLSQAEIFEKDPRKVLGPATTEDRESWFKDRTPAWSERYGGGWSRVEQLVTASRSAADRQRRRDRLMTRTLSIVTVVLLAALAVAGLLWQVAEERKTNADKMRYLAEEQRKVAEEQRKVAEEQRKVAEEQGGQADDILSSATNIIVKLQTNMDDDTKKEAFLVFTRGADHGDSSSMRNLGVSYRDAIGIARDYAKAREWYEKAVAKGNTYAMVDLGLLYANGQGVTQDYVRAREWYEKAVAQDNADAMINLGLLYTNGQGVAQDHAIAREWYEKAAEKGEETAMFNLGVLYANGRGVAQDYAKAREWYEKAAAKGYASALLNLGVLYVNGQGVTQDYIKAREWYEKAAANDDAIAMFNLGLLYVNGKGVTQDYIRAREWYEKAAANDHAGAMRNLGLLYENGQSVTQDYVKAREWYEKAVAKGNTDAMVDLGLLYENGQGVTQDHVKAREWYEKAVAEEHTSAMVMLGLLYEHGRGVVQDYAQAHEWYEKAVAKDNAIAMRFLGVLYQNGQGVAQDYATAREWYEKAAAKDDATAMVNLALLYANGHGVTQDYAKARVWYENAVAKGNTGAMASLKRLLIVEAAAAGRYAKALQLQESLAVEVEAVETKREGKPGEETAEALLPVAWYALFAREFRKALVVAGRAHALLPDNLAIETNRAHALMFLGRGKESKALYLAYKGKPLSKQDAKLWERVIAEDFAELRKAGLRRPMMADIEKELGVSSSSSTTSRRERAVHR
jgi:uncharacterized protein